MYIRTFETQPLVQVQCDEWNLIIIISECEFSEQGASRILIAFMSFSIQKFHWKERKAVMAHISPVHGVLTSCAIGGA